MSKQHSPSCERNSEPIGRVLSEVLKPSMNVLEVGSGTGQHAVYFGKEFPDVVWQPSDVPGTLDSIRAWLEESSLKNVKSPIELDVAQQPWGTSEKYDVIFSANTLHIMSWNHVKAFIKALPFHLAQHGQWLVYGPFNYGGKFTSESNQQFEKWLKGVDPVRGIRDFEKIEAAANEVGLELVKDYEMPANNRILRWRLKAG